MAVDEQGRVYVTDYSLGRVEVFSTGGNPFFMEEVVQAEIESGALVGTRGRFRLERPIEGIEVPSTVQSLLAARIDRLDETSKRLLQTAAVIGDELSETLLEHVTELDSDTLRSGIRRLVQSEFLYEASLYPVSEYAFKHPLTREVAYASLLRERRRAIHAAVAEALRAKPDLSLSYLKNTLLTKQPGGLDPYLEGLRKAGLPE